MTSLYFSRSFSVNMATVKVSNQYEIYKHLSHSSNKTIQRECCKVTFSFRLQRGPKTLHNAYSPLNILLPETLKYIYMFWEQLFFLCLFSSKNQKQALWPSGRSSDSGARGQGLDPHSGRRVVSLSKIHLPPKKYW